MPPGTHTTARIFSALACMTALLVGGSALAADPSCGDLRELERSALSGRLEAGTADCLEADLSVVGPEHRVRTSFVLVVAAHVSGDVDRYEQHLRRHLFEVHSSDADVAYLYALMLSKKGVAWGEDVIRWANVALANKWQWVEHPRTFASMVRSLYHLRNDAAMNRAVEAEKRHRARPTSTNEQRLEQYRERSRRYLVISAPCLAQGECGPQFEVVVEDVTDCEDLWALQSNADRGVLVPPQITCLKGRYQRPAAPRVRLLDLLATNADNSTDPGEWERLLGWHRNFSGVDDPYLGLRYARFLTAGGPPYAHEALRRTELAIRNLPMTSKRRGRRWSAELHRLRALAAYRVWESAVATDAAGSTVDTRSRLERARSDALETRQALDTLCGYIRCKGAPPPRVEDGRATRP